jgi:hypothetical protein
MHPQPQKKNTKRIIDMLSANYTNLAITPLSLQNNPPSGSTATSTAASSSAASTSKDKDIQSSVTGQTFVLLLVFILYIHSLLYWDSILSNFI